MYPKTCKLRIVLLGCAVIMSPNLAGAATDGELQISVVDSQTRLPIPARVQFTNARGRPVRMRNVGSAPLGDHFYLSGTATLGLRRGDYQFNMDSGAEYRTQRGNFKIDRHADDAKTVEMRRFANLADEGWFAGDLDLTRPARDLPIAAVAEGIHYAPTIAWQFDGKAWKKSHALVTRPVDTNDAYATGRELGPTAALVDLAGGSLLLVADQPLEKPPLDLDATATSLGVLRQARAAGLHVLAATPTAWELPVWLASDELDGVFLLTRQNEWHHVVDKDANGRPRDKSFYPGKRDLQRWGQDIYFHALNCGIQLTPLAGSGSGANESPLGTNRTYVRLTNSFARDDWWQAVERGAVVVTNGPLIRPSVGGDPPGTTFGLDDGETIDFQIALNLASRQPVEYLEILKNGEVSAEVRLSDWAAKGGKLPPVEFEASGWFAIRAATNNPKKPQFALTAPYYVASPAGPRISRASVEFFLAWLDDLEPRIGSQASCTAEELASARHFFRDLLARANAD